MFFNSCTHTTYPTNVLRHYTLVGIKYKVLLCPYIPKANIYWSQEHPIRLSPHYKNCEFNNFIAVNVEDKEINKWATESWSVVSSRRHCALHTMLLIHKDSLSPQPSQPYLISSILFNSTTVTISITRKKGVRTN